MVNLFNLKFVSISFLLCRFLLCTDSNSVSNGAGVSNRAAIFLMLLNQVDPVWEIDLAEFSQVAFLGYSLEDYMNQLNKPILTRPRMVFCRVPNHNEDQSGVTGVLVWRAREVLACIETNPGPGRYNIQILCHFFP